MEERHPIAANIGQEPRRREPTAQHHGRPRRQRGRPCLHDAAGVEHRHRDVGHVLGVDAPLDHRHPGTGDLAVGHPNRLGLATRPRGEDEHQQLGFVHGAVNGNGTVADGGQRGKPLGTVDGHDPIRADANGQAVKEGSVLLVGDDQLAVRRGDVASQLGAPPGGIDADDDRIVESGRTQQKGELGNVVEQHADVERSFASPRRQQCGPVRAGVDVLDPRTRSAPQSGWRDDRPQVA